MTQTSPDPGSSPVTGKTPSVDLPEALRANLSRVILGKPEAIEYLLIALLANGHALIEDVPGVGKTLAARALARSFRGTFRRVQFTPDLLPADITGVPVLDPRDQSFHFRPGPLFANILLADELNRATPRTQAALLEAMEERQVTVDGTTHPLPKPFTVLATQNPIEQQGVYELPEAQLDRFLLQVSLGYPDAETEVRIISSQLHNLPIDSLEPVATPADLLAAQDAVRHIHVDSTLLRYAVDLCAATRRHSEVSLGASPRASLGLIRASQAASYLRKQAFVTPEILRELVLPVLRHRLVLKPYANLSGRTAPDIVSEILQVTPLPLRMDSVE
jgi:MoxR-like ATPase